MVKPSHLTKGIRIKGKKMNENILNSKKGFMGYR